MRPFQLTMYKTSMADCSRRCTAEVYILVIVLL